VGLNHRLLPRDKWFQGMAWLIERQPSSTAGQKSSAGPQAADPIATGSLPPSATVTPPVPEPGKDR
jgi:hypothetical protein